MALLRFHELVSEEPPPVDWLIEGLLARGRLGMLVGDPGCGKTWLLADLGLCLAMGEPAFGQFPTQPGPVVFIDEEAGRAELGRRLSRLAVARGLPEQVALSALCFAGLRLDRAEDLVKLGNLLREERPVLTLVDSLTRVHRQPENQAPEMAAMFDRVSRLQRVTGTAFLFAHHARKASLAGNSAGQRARGTIDLPAVVDTHIDLRVLRDGRLLVEVAKLRQAVAPGKFLLRVQDGPDSSTFVSWEGWAGEAEGKAELASQFVLDTLAEAGGLLERQELLEKGRAAGYSEATLKRALEALLEAGEVEKGPKDGRRVTYRLPEVAAGLFQG